MNLELPEERSRNSRSYTEPEWEAQREVFRRYYVDQNLSLKEAAKCMKENHNFDATPRQWERRIAPDKWAFQKYESRETRLKAINAAGKSLLEVGQRGRRKSTASDGRPVLSDDRNMRRFARREASRESRRRARSVSTLSDQFSDMSDQDMLTSPPSPIDGPADSYLPNLINPFAPPGVQHQDSFQWTITSDEDTNMQMNLADLPTISISGADEHASFISPAQIPISDQAQVNVHMPSANMDHETFNAFVPPHTGQFSPPITITGQTNGYDPSTDFPNFGQPQHPGNAMSPPLDNTIYADQGSPESYTNMLDSIGQTLNAAGSIEDHNNQHVAFDSHNHSMRIVPEIEAYSGDFQTNSDDPIHTDVHDQLDLYGQNVLDLITDCFSDCMNINFDDPHARNTALTRLQLLRSQVEAQNITSNRRVRMTLKNVATTQRRATQSVRDLATKLRRERDQLRRENKTLTMGVISEIPDASSTAVNFNNTWVPG